MKRLQNKLWAKVSSSVLHHPPEAHKNEKKMLFKDEHENFPHDNFITFTLYVQKLAKKNFLEA